MDRPIDWQEYDAAPAGGVWTHYADVSNGHAFRKKNGDVVVYSEGELEGGAPPEDSDDDVPEVPISRLVDDVEERFRERREEEQAEAKQLEAFAEMTASIMASVYGKGVAWEDGIADRLQTVCADPAEAKQVFTKIIHNVA